MKPALPLAGDVSVEKIDIASRLKYGVYCVLVLTSGWGITKPWYFNIGDYYDPSIAVFDPWPDDCVNAGL